MIDVPPPMETTTLSSPLIHVDTFRVRSRSCFHYYLLAHESIFEGVQEEAGATGGVGESGKEPIVVSFVLWRHVQLPSPDNQCLCYLGKRASPCSISSSSVQLQFPPALRFNTRGALLLARARAARG